MKEGREVKGRGGRYAFVVGWSLVVVFGKIVYCRCEVKYIQSPSSGNAQREVFFNMVLGG